LNIIFPFKQFEFQIIPEEPIILPSYKGSTLRDGFGNAFKRVVCAIKHKECNNCILKEKCVYSYIFETPPPSDTKIMRKYTSAPHPFIIEPPSEKRRGYTPKDKITFGLILIGKALDYLPYFIYAFSKLGNIGIGKARGRYVLKTVKSNGKVIYDSTTKLLKTFKSSSLEADLPHIENKNTKLLTLNFLTPARIVYNNHLTLTLNFTFL